MSARLTSYVVVVAGDFFPPETRRAFGLVTKSRTFAERIVGHPLWLGVTRALLSTTLNYNWVRMAILARRVDV